jgi:leader peptidase (prepilin peptidase)/N-methyltransferase
LWLKGNCRYCQRPISRLYPLVEFLTGLATIIWALRFGLFPSELWKLVLLYGLIAISGIDLRFKIIPNKLTYPLMVAGLIYRWTQGELRLALSGGIIGGSILLLVKLLYPKGMGMGDVKLLTLLGVLLGWKGVLHALFLASLSGMLMIFPLLLSGKVHRQEPIPFAPFLALGAVIVIFYF